MIHIYAFECLSMICILLIAFAVTQLTLEKYTGYVKELSFSFCHFGINDAGPVTVNGVVCI